MTRLAPALAALCWSEDSLMSTMMQAPNLFGAIAAVWIPFALASASA